MEVLNPRNEIADLEWRRVTSLVWPILGSIAIIQALFSAIPLQPWQLIFTVGLLFSMGLSYLLGRRQILNFADIPTVVYLILSPYVIGERAQTPWLSIGLVIFAAVIYFSTLENATFAILLVLGLCIFQSYTANLHLASITDSEDLSLFHSYFSFIWTSVIGISSFFIRRRYLLLANSIEEKVAFEIDESVNRISSLKQVNQRDSRNIRLHGTILNTLIHIRNLVLSKSEFASALPRLRSEINELAADSTFYSEMPFANAIDKVISERMLNRIKIKLEHAPSTSPSHEVQESVLEILREYLLNAEKHSSATEIKVHIISSGSGISITFTDDALSQFGYFQLRNERRKPLESKTLHNLLIACGAETDLALLRATKIRKVTIVIPEVNVENEIATTISRARILGLNDFVFNFVRAGILVTILSIPGYFLVGIPRITLFLLLISTIAFIYLVQVSLNRYVLLFAIAGSALLIPSMSNHIESCESVATLPWIWNHVLTLCYFVAIVGKNRYLKWTPIVILSLESLLIPFGFPSECKSIFLGSLPAIPLIIVMAVAVLGVRKRELNYDNLDSAEVARLAQISNEADQFREIELKRLVEESRPLATKLDQNLESSLILNSLNLEIQKLQTFLVCSEYFDSVLVRRVYELFRNQLNNGVPGRITILGMNIADGEKSVAVNSVLRFIENEKNGRPLNLTIIRNHTLELHFDGYSPDELPAPESLEIAGLPVFKNL